jgi:hypothetical protein
MSQIITAYTAAIACDFVACVLLEPCQSQRARIYWCKWDLVRNPKRINRDVGAARDVYRRVAESAPAGRMLNIAIPVSYMSYLDRLCDRKIHNIHTLFILREDAHLHSEIPALNKLLGDDNIRSIVAHNVEFHHPKLQWIPLGICGDTNNCWTTAMHSVRTDVLPEEKLLYVNFTIITNREHRTAVARALRENGFEMQQIVPKQEFMAIMATFAFCASPDGRAKDCYRTWEAIAGGCTPLVDDWPYARAVAPWLPVVWVGAPPPRDAAADAAPAAAAAADAAAADAAAAAADAAAAAADAAPAAAAAGGRPEYLHLPSWQSATASALRALLPAARERMRRVGPGFLSRSVWEDLFQMEKPPPEPLICAALRMSLAKRASCGSGSDPECAVDRKRVHAE